jgi:FtsZ-binding cell division protein ZapB
VERQRLAEGLQRKESTLESFNMEVDSLNNKINTLTNEINQRRAMSESGDGHFEKIEKLTAEKARLSEELHGAQARVTKLTMEVANLKDKAAERFREKSDFKEKLIVAEAIAKQHSEAHPSEPILTKLQGIWKDLGVSEIYREDAQRKIDTCLEDTCNRILEEASKLKANTIAEINRLENELTSISSVLGKDPPPVIDVKANGVTLLPLCESLREEASKIRPEYLSAVERRMNLVNDARTLVDAIGREKAQPSSKLTELIEGQEKQGSSIKSGREQRAEVLRNVQGMVDSLDRLMGSDSTEDHEMESITEPSSPLTDDYNYGPPRSLHVDVLDSCEKEVSRLRLLKSEILVQNSEVREEIAALVKDMHLSADEIVALTEQVVDFQNENTSAWWATDVALQVARSLLDNESCVLTTPAFSKHLDSIRLAMETVAAHRRSLSQALKGAVDRAQKTLLMTVDGETDVSEAYASFHDALFQLPSLSKEHVDACIAELNALVAGVDAMRQSEVEALTVVWEALDVRPNQRSSFWSKLEEDTTQMQLTDENLFDSVRSVESRYKESWVVKATNEAHKVYADLSMRLFKLESIHRSVETLRTRQDAKSRIISLDSEIRILSAKLGDFEDKRCSKSRLLTKKTGSGALLKEERFRKQMQTKFTSKLEQLARLLRIWIETEGESFDANLLSDEVRNLLDNADCMETYVESRTVRMHLNLKTHSTSATSNGKRSRPEMRTTRSRSDESRSWSPNRPNTSRTGSRDGPSPPASRPRKVARTGRCAIAAPSPQHDGSKSISRSATNKRKAEVRSKSPIKPKIRRTGRDGASTLLLSPSPQENGQAMRMDKPKRGASTRARESQSIMPFGNLLAESEKISSPTFSSSLHSTQGKENY